MWTQACNKILKLGDVQKPDGDGQTGKIRMIGGSLNTDHNAIQRTTERYQSKTKNGNKCPFL